MRAAIVVLLLVGGCAIPSAAQESREPLYARAEATLTTSGKTPEQNLSELLRVIAPPVRSKEPASAG